MEHTSFPRSALAVKSTNSINASGTVKASCAGAVVDVHRALGACPTVDADTRETTDIVGAGRAVLADLRPVGYNNFIRFMKKIPEQQRK